MGGAHSRRKGHSFEREVAISLREIFPQAKRQLEYQADTCNGVDITEVGNYRIQCKKLKAYASVNTIKEIKCDKNLGEVPILVTASDRGEWMAVIPFEDLKRLMVAAHVA